LTIYGRKTYQLMVPYWPDIAKERTDAQEDIQFADAFCVLRKVVFSRTLDSAEGNTRIVRANLRGEMLELKQEQGKNILAGGVDIPSQRIAIGLVDEFRFVVWPVIAGQGRRLMEGMNLQEKLQLRLADSRVFKSGAIALRYWKP
jgi:dihydrofolate reductase